jgi:hypothetical protein
MGGLFFFLLKSVGILVLEEEVVMVLCSQIVYMLDKYLIKRYVVSFIFTQYVLCENARLVPTMILLDPQRWCLDFWILRKTPNVNNFFFDFLPRKINDQ